MYILCDSTCNGSVNVSIMAYKNGVDNDCTYNPGMPTTTYPYTVNPGIYKYCSSTVYERYGSGTQARLKMTVYTGGTYTGVWSPDNLNGY